VPSTSSLEPGFATRVVARTAEADERREERVQDVADTYLLRGEDLEL